MTTKQELYDKAGAHLSQERADLTDDVLLVRELDAVYDATLLGCLEEGLWKWSFRTVQLSADPSIDTTDFGGRKYGFTMPDDFVRIENINTSPYFTPEGELDDYDWDGQNTVYSDRASFYLRYVSKGTSYGLNLALWPEAFANGVGARLAAAAALRVTKSKADRDDATKEGDVWIAKAKVRDAVEKKVRRRPIGRLIASRFGSRRRPNPRGGIWD
jgi:hypothetical protein